MRAGPANIAKILLDSLPLDSKPMNIVDHIGRILIEKGWESNTTNAREKAESWKNQTLTWLRREISSLSEVGRPSRICFNSSSDYMIQGSCFIEPKDSPDVQESKIRRLRSDAFYNLLLDINPGDFEKLCGKLIQFFGVENPTVTRKSADEGIDFFGKLTLESLFFPQDLTPTIQRQLTIWLVGQAKRYIESQSGTGEIRDLVGAVQLGRAQVFGSSESPYPTLKIRVSDPVFTLLITTGRFSANAWKLLNRSGVIGMDGEMLAAFLSDREAGIITDKIEKDAFLTWIKET
jgi:hypothetical protein